MLYKIDHNIVESKTTSINLSINEEVNTKYFQGDINKKCFDVKYRNESDCCIESSYYVGTDWLNENQAIYVEPKLNNGNIQIDYLRMMLTCMQHSEVNKHTNRLVDIKFNVPLIEIEQKQDMLSPLLVVQFIHLLHSIVQKGLKKSYYNVEHNLYSRVKGKLLISKTIKQNVVRNKSLYNHCSYEEFGLNCFENRLLKKTLLFVQRYVASTMKEILGSQSELQANLQKTINYCMGAMHSISDTIEMHELKAYKKNVFYKEYCDGIHLSKLILKRYGYNIDRIQNTAITKTPPYWIDMSLLFELYVLCKLKERFGKGILFQFKANYGYLDYLLKEQKIIVDAKYKRVYSDKYAIDDIRQLSAYARDVKVLEKLGYSKEEQLHTVADCLIIYPVIDKSKENLPDQLLSENSKITQFNRFYKIGINLPIVQVDN